MNLTILDIMARLKQLDEITLMEILEITSEDLVERFSDRIEDRFDELEEDTVGMDGAHDFESEED